MLLLCHNALITVQYRFPPANILSIYKRSKGYTTPKSRLCVYVISKVVVSLSRLQHNLRVGVVYLTHTPLREYRLAVNLVSDWSRTKLPSCAYKRERINGECFTTNPDNERGDAAGIYNQLWL